MKTAALFIALAACTNDPVLTLGEQLVADCGKEPTAPSWTANVDGNVTLSQADFGALTKWRADVLAWQTCAVEHP